MDKPKRMVVGLLAVIVLLAAGLLVYLRGFDAPTDQVTITTSVSNEEADTSTTTAIVLDGANSYLKQETTNPKDGETQSERGLKSYEVEDFQEYLQKLRIRLSLPEKDKACLQDSSDKNDSLTITQNDKLKGAVYFCDGVGVDEETNITGPYQDLYKLVEDTEV